MPGCGYQQYSKMPEKEEGLSPPFHDNCAYATRCYALGRLACIIQYKHKTVFPGEKDLLQVRYKQCSTAA